MSDLTHPISNSTKNVFLWFLAFLVAGIATLFAANFNGGETLALALLLLFVLTFPVLWKWRRGNLDLFEPITLFSGTAVIYWVGKAIYILLRNYPIYQYFPWPESRIDYLDLALVYAIVGTIFLIIGYFGVPIASKKKPIIERCADWNGAGVGLFTAAFFIIGIAALVMVVKSAGGIIQYFIMLPSRGEIFEGKGYYYLLAQWPNAGLLLVYTHLLSKGKRSKSFWALFALAVLLSASQGGRAGILKIILSMIVISHYVVRRMNFKRLAPVLALAIIIILAGNFLRLQSQRYDNAGFWDRLYSRGDFDVVDTFMVTLKNVPDVVPYQLGMTYIAVLTGPIPRSVFPTKPYGAAGVYTSILFPEFWDAKNTFSPGILSELYMNFGSLGIIIGMMVYGALLRMIYEKLSPWKGPTQNVLVYAMVTPFAFGAQWDFFTAVQTLLYTLVPVLVALRFCKQKCVE